LAGLPAAMCAFAVAASAASQSRQWRTTLVAAGIALGLAMAVVGFDSVVTRFQMKGMVSDASFRTLLATTTLQGAAEFWPLGAGWGTYAAVYPRFQPFAVDGFAGHAHHDYAELLFDGGIFAVLLMAAFGWLAVSRAVQLVRTGLRRRRLRSVEMASAICGLGLLGFLLHSFVEFNMHIPANAIAASLLAGAFLRPLRREGDEESNGD
ncbi:MAG TPA: O-antigen ligase family protein, partial [Ramlibacter sp.]